MIEAKNITMQLFLWFLFIVIALFIAFWLYNMHKEYTSTEGVELEEIASLQCGGYMFEISDVAYQNNTLSLTIRNTIGDTLDNMVIESDYDSRTEKLDLGRGRKKNIVLEDFKAAETVAVYPEGCAQFSVELIHLNEQNAE